MVRAAALAPHVVGVGTPTPLSPDVLDEARCLASWLGIDDEIANLAAALRVLLDNLSDADVEPGMLSALALLADRADEIADAARVVRDLDFRLHQHDLAVAARTDAGVQQ